MGKNNSSIPSEIEEIITVARDDFDLGATLRGKGAMTRSVRVFTDKETGAELGGSEVFEDTSLGFPRPQVRNWGVTGQIVELSRTPELEEQNADEIAKLKKKVVKLAEKLESTSIELTLRSLPPIIKKDAKRAAKEALKINGKLTADHPRFEEFVDEEDAQLLHRAVVTWVRAEDDIERKGMSIENARALKAHLEEFEYGKIQAKLAELLWTRQISDKAVEDADF
ncbi:hypothetical protein MRBLMI12_000509 [Microbacterium sp. LMI12-1-1.1]|uniref:hypothetical protein n=1 Tax=Microbacterium sp. LMI12-1-1.1 TaxID=3135225 RepID=UPI003448B847